MTTRKAPIPRKTAAQQPVSLETTAQKDNAFERLMALRDGIARQLDDCPSKRDYAALSRQMQQVLAEIELRRKSPKSIRNELAEKRRARQAAAAIAGLSAPVRSTPAGEPQEETEVGDG